jgi:hypothetical protein
LILVEHQLAGRNSHHIIEATFKAFARALRQATEYDPRRHGTIPRFVIVLFSMNSHYHCQWSMDQEASTPPINIWWGSIQPRFVIVLLAFGGHGFNPSQALISSIRFDF